MKVVLQITNMFENTIIAASDKNNTFIINSKKVSYDAKKFVDTLRGLLLSWDRKYIGPQTLDGETCEILLSNGTDERMYRCSNSFPKNYAELKELIEEVKKCVK